MKPIKGYEGRYSATEDGFIYSHLSNRNLIGYKTKNGYIMVVLRDENGVEKKFLVHRLICEAYHNKKAGCFEVNHINFNKEDNSAKNLEWTSRRENVLHALKNGRYDESRKKRYKPVYAISNSGERRFYKSMREAEKDGFQESNITNCVRGKIKTHKGYKWILAEEYAI